MTMFQQVAVVRNDVFVKHSINGSSKLTPDLASFDIYLLYVVLNVIECRVTVPIVRTSIYV